MFNTFMPYIAVAVCVMLFLWVYRGGLAKYAKELLLCLVTQAEQTYGSGMGKLKYAAVAARLYEVMPKLFKFIFSKEKVAFMIESALCEMKECINNIDTEEKNECKE